MQRALYWVLFAALLFPSAALAEMKLYRNIKNWTISYDLQKQDCIAMSNHHYNGTHLIVRIPNHQAGWQVGLYNKTWNVSNDQNYPIKVWIDGVALLQGNARSFGGRGLSMHLSKGAPYARRFKSRFQKGNRMVVRGIGARKWTATLGLHGTSAAVDATIQCANYIRRLPRQLPPVASAGSHQQRSGFQFIKRSAMITLVANTLSKQGITGYRILPAIPNSSAVKVQFTDGTRRTYLAASGNTKDADDYIDVVTADYRRQCKGNFAVSVQKIGTTTGDVRRVADMLCTQGTRAVKSVLSVVRTPDGLLFATVTVPPTTTSSPPSTKKKPDQDQDDRA